jgi:hypothetical protein
MEWGSTMLDTNRIGVLLSELKHDLSHPYVDSYLSRPEIDQDKVLIYYFLFSYQKRTEQPEKCTKSVMIAETGLKTHDKMAVTLPGEADAIKKSQLTVLAGDYYSALYYYILSRTGDMEIVEWVAEAIQNYNTEKCRLYYPAHRLSWTQTVQILARIESALISHVAAKLGYDWLVPALSDFFLCKLLSKNDMLQQKNGYDSFLFRFLSDHITDDRAVLRQLMNEEIKRAEARFNERIKRSMIPGGGFSDLITDLSSRLNTICRCTAGEE